MSNFTLLLPLCKSLTVKPSKCFKRMNGVKFRNIATVYLIDLVVCH